MAIHAAGGDAEAKETLRHFVKRGEQVVRSLPSYERGAREPPDNTQVEQCVVDGTVCF